MEGEGGRVCHATDRPRSGDPLLHAGPGRLPHRGRPVHRPAARQARRKAPGGPPWLNSATARIFACLGFGSSTASRSIISHPRRRSDRVATDVRYWPKADIQSASLPHLTRRLWALRELSPASHLAYSFRQVRPAASSTNLGFDGMHVGVGTKLRRPDELSQFVNDGIRDNVPYDLNFDRTGIPKEFTLHRVITEVFYIGLGDQFDDDRRRIRRAE